MSYDLYKSYSKIQFFNALEIQYFRDYHAFSENDIMIFESNFSLDLMKDF